MDKSTIFLVSTGVGMGAAGITILTVALSRYLQRRWDQEEREREQEQYDAARMADRDGMCYVPPPQKCSKYSYADENVLTWLKTRGPLVETCAGSGWLAHQLRQLGVDIIAYDRELYSNNYTEVIQAENGTVEQQHPDRTLLIVNGFDVVKSVDAFTGNKIIIGGYHFDEVWDSCGTGKVYALGSRKEMDIRPCHEFMEERGFTKLDEVNCRSSEKPGLRYVYRCYTRSVPLVLAASSDEIFSA